MCSWQFVTANESFLARQPMTKREFGSKSPSYSFIVINKPCKAQFLLRVLACCNIRMCSLNIDCIFVFRVLPEKTALIPLQACNASDHRDINRWDAGFESHVGREHMSAFFFVVILCRKRPYDRPIPHPRTRTRCLQTRFTRPRWFAAPYSYRHGIDVQVDRQTEGWIDGWTDRQAYRFNCFVF